MKSNSKLLVSIVTSVSILCLSGVPTFAATTAVTPLSTTRSTSTAMHSLAASEVSISTTNYSLVTTGPLNTPATLPLGDNLVFGMNAVGGSGNYQYQFTVVHQNQKGSSDGLTEYTSPYSTSGICIYRPQQSGYYYVNISVLDTTTGVVVRSIYMPKGLYGTILIDVE
ncbi:hypothetical protein [Clostridium tagluense]|uniref:Peptidase C-terminal archaeal/bacterial domain-containing protein n=1 Tax=Clostridium tagluense TaxID=360422 RepID=A0A401US72_9CLOT|nr:hypothetical protein [Clostridium tagluense]GCD12393.1 hypothetical protein Ctaglu_40160 [Clostridium tagluense]